MRKRQRATLYRRRRWLHAAALGSTLAVVLLSSGGPPAARANGRSATAVLVTSGVGPSIALGAVSGNTVPVNATTTAPDPYKGFNLHIHAEPGAGVTITSITASGANTVLPTTNSGPPFCTRATPSGLPNDKVFACTALADLNVPGADGTTASGLLGSFTINATGDGCVAVWLVTQPDSNKLDTFTVNEADSRRQSNVVDTTSLARVVVGRGSPQDCPARPLVIGSVTPVANQGSPAIVIRGSGFGNSFPAADIGVSTTTPYLRISGPGLLPGLTWSAGHTGDGCKVTVARWTDNLIVLSADGVGGLSVGCPLFTGDPLTLTVWSTPDTSASASTTVPVVAPGAVGVVSISEVDGPTGGGTFAAPGSGAVTITGTGFYGTWAVLFGPFPSTSFFVTNDTTIVAVPPPAATNERVSVRVVTDGGSSPTCGPVIQTGCDYAYFYMASRGSWTTPVRLPGSFSQTIDGVTVTLSVSGTLTPDLQLETAQNGSLPSAFIVEGTLGVDATIQATVSGGLSLGGPVDIPIPVGGLPDIVHLSVRLQSAQLSASVTAGTTLQGQLSFYAVWIPDAKGAIALPVNMVDIPSVGFPFVQQHATLTCAGAPLSGCLSSAHWPAGAIGGAAVVSPLWLEVGPQLGVLNVDAGIGPEFGLAGGVTSGGTTYSEVCGDVGGEVEALGFKLPRRSLLGPFEIAGSSPTHCPLGDSATSSSPTGNASVVISTVGGGTVAGSAAGAGTLTMAPYTADPVAAPDFPATGDYFDAHLSPASSFSGLTITDCALGGGDSLRWWTGGSWQIVQPAGSVDPTTGCLTTTLDASSSPTLSQLMGTAFGVSECPIRRADVDGDGVISILDLAAVAGDFGENVPPAPAAYDQDGDGVISILDLAQMAGVFLQPVTACP